MSKGSFITLEELFASWVDYDHAQYYIACLLGIMEYNEDLRSIFHENSSIFNTRTKLGDSLFHILTELVELGLLEESDAGIGYRFNKSFKSG